MNGQLLHHVLDHYLLEEELRELLAEHEEPTDGSKAELVGRVMAIVDLDPAEAVEYLDHRELTELSAELNLPAKGTRDELFDRVLARVASDPAA